ncbi:hypothetical protein E4U42_004021 [Claviceps africana]|uniref:Uncharacterized protein n=1 Tax=Claviceps africana TaxID=83212 RepID=A0A8K0J886_9HYPO|nr:hypothetical protein E4U42_004021 [Claviceps africana]
MPWKPPASGLGIHRPRAGSKSIRGQISSPIPIFNSLNDELLMSDRPGRPSATLNDGAYVNDAVVEDADTVARQTVEGGHRVGTRYASVSSHSTGNYTMQSQLMDATSSVVAPTSISAKSSTTAPTQPRRSYPPVSDVEATRDERGGQDPEHHRKKSSIRSALGKLFGRKTKGQQQHKDDVACHLPGGKTISAEPPWTAPNQPSSSDPSGQGPSAARSVVESKRSFSAPITEYDRALRSHSIGPEDVMAIQSARNSLSADFRLSGKCMSLVDSSAHPENLRWTSGSRLAGLSPRPASSQDRIFRADVDEDPREIGRAISCDPQGLKRRSRSLTFMSNFDIVSTPSPPRAIIRRRSAEIRYWRDGHAAPLMSPNRTLAHDEFLYLPTQGPETQDVGLESHLEPEQETLPEPRPQPQSQPGPGPERQRQFPLEPEPLPKSTPLRSSPRIEERVVTPPQPVMMHPEGEDEEGGREACQNKGPTRSIDFDGWIETTSLESRVSNLETRMSRLEGIVIQLGNSLSVLRQPTKESRLEMAFVGDHSHSISRLSTCHSNTSKTTFGDVGEVTPRTTVVSPTALSCQQQRYTVDESTSHSGGHVTLEHYTNLLALLETERSAREALEAQVSSLGTRLHLLSKSVTYTSTDQSDSPSLNRSLGEISVFDHEEEDDHRRLIVTSPYPLPPLGFDDSAIAPDVRPGDEYTDYPVRPAETTNGGLEAFGNGDEGAPRPLCTNKVSCGRPTTKPTVAVAQRAAHTKQMSA